MPGPQPAESPPVAIDVVHGEGAECQHVADHVAIHPRVLPKPPERDARGAHAGDEDERAHRMRVAEHERDEDSSEEPAEMVARGPRDAHVHDEEAIQLLRQR
eukprot:CAMPEP_0180049130 /NCGR_PEP_ID=MMETSP0984-20121128/38659_1 /TAXON_ID=483367 /ORGANISM="non described non described, Strain CCMP 2436" /LENGTH=101 /DNA_ID=CAMNT_0021978077 /DNA_START=187 /DNA_END=492 /DNA_ORIENTATION=+